MTLVLKPKGRGNWTKTTVEINGGHVSPLTVRVGQLIEFGGVLWRICAVLA